MARTHVDAPRRGYETLNNGDLSEVSAQIHLMAAEALAWEATLRASER